MEPREDEGSVVVFHVHEMTLGKTIRQSTKYGERGTQRRG